MVIKTVCDRDIRDVVTSLLAYQRDAPIHIRMVSPRICDAILSDGDKLSEKINDLITYKNALVTLVVKKKGIKDDKEDEILQTLQDMGVKIHFRKNLHVKTILLTTNKEKGVLITSSNLTPTGLGSQREMGVYFLNEMDHIHERVDRYLTKLLGEESPIR